MRVCQAQPEPAARGKEDGGLRGAWTAKLAGLLDRATLPSIGDSGEEGSCFAKQLFALVPSRSCNRRHSKRAQSGRVPLRLPMYKEDTTREVPCDCRRGASYGKEIDRQRSLLLETASKQSSLNSAPAHDHDSRGLAGAYQNYC